MKVLIIDDSNVAYGNISILVERLGIEVLGNATTEKEIENSVKRHTPELVLMDTRASYIQGVDTIRKIKTISPETNIVAVSVFENQQAVKQIFASGISDIITKPVEAERLIESLRKLGLLDQAEDPQKQIDSEDEDISIDAEEVGLSPEAALKNLNNQLIEQDLDQLVSEISDVLPQTTAQAETSDKPADELTDEAANDDVVQLQQQAV